MNMQMTPCDRSKENEGHYCDFENRLVVVYRKSVEFACGSAFLFIFGHIIHAVWPVAYIERCM